MERYGERDSFVNEESVTKIILGFLLKRDFEIISFDFPGSGTGKLIRPKVLLSLEQHKNKNGIIPDILAYRENTLLFFENKAQETFSDFDKIVQLSNDSALHESIHEFCAPRNINKVLWGIGFGGETHSHKKYNDYKNINIILNIKPPEDILILKGQEYLEIQ
jgi:hypothetical protein